MTVRTRNTIVTFRRPFHLAGLDEVLPAGAYGIETDEELLAGISFPAYRRILTLMHLHTEPGHPGVERLLTVDPRELDEALERDQAPAEIPADTASGQKTLTGTADSRHEEADRQAVARAESEGMMLRPG
ncbi:MAG: hypothetical protein OEN55_01630 [Alphaproteobacteria bacterium]|nr:hypothetical protein [Alphaproteobacteria bacterium]